MWMPRFARQNRFFAAFGDGNLICGPAGRSAFLFYFFIYFIFAASGGERE